MGDGFLIFLFLSTKKFVIVYYYRLAIYIYIDPFVVKQKTIETEISMKAKKYISSISVSID